MNSFRDFEKSLCILWDRACINILDPDQVSGANGILCYPDEGEQEVTDAKTIELKTRVNQRGWRSVW